MDTDNRSCRQGISHTNLLSGIFSANRFTKQTKEGGEHVKRAKEKKAGTVSREITAVIGGTAFSCGCVLAYATAFDPYLSGHFGRNALLAALLASCAAALFSRLRHAGPLLGAVLIGFSIFLFMNRGTLTGSFFSAAAPLVSQYQRAFGYFPNMDAEAMEMAGLGADAFLIAVIVLLSFFVSLTVVRKWMLFPTALIGALILGISCAVYETEPSQAAILLFCAAALVLLIAREGLFHRGQGRDLLALKAAVPAFALMFCVIAFINPWTYTAPSWTVTLQERIDRYFGSRMPITFDQQTGGLKLISPSAEGSLGNQSWNEDLSGTDLTQVGPREDSDTTVMEVQTDYEGRLYLRGFAFTDYSGSSWFTPSDDTADSDADVDSSEALSSETETATQDAADMPPESETDPAENEDSEEVAGTADNRSGITAADWAAEEGYTHQIMIQTEKHSLIYYLPYVPAGVPEEAETQEDLQLLNVYAAASYRIPFHVNVNLLNAGETYTDYVYATYLTVPAETRESLADITELFDPDLDADSLAEAVAEYVSNSAVYDKATDYMPEGEDFVSWFLHESDTGYCVHYASAAAVLLRCLGVPARFVNGYVTETQADGWAVVTQADAHAWVEYYVPEEGWKLLDPTPASEEEAEISEAESEEEESEEAVIEAESVQEEPEVVSEAEESEANADNAMRIPGWLLRMLAIAFGIVAFYLIWRQLLVHALSVGSPKERIRKSWRLLRAASCLTGVPIPKRAEALAMKAGFSPHEMTEGELAEMENERKHFAESVRRSHSVRRWLLILFPGIS